MSSSFPLDDVSLVDCPYCVDAGVEVRFDREVKRLEEFCICKVGEVARRKWLVEYRKRTSGGRTGS